MEISNQGIIYDIQRYASHDGPGIRTLVFLKGCPLRCIWCSNPESQSLAPEIMHFPEKCINCNRCVKACKYGAMIFSRSGRDFISGRCSNCGKCADACLTGAIVKSGSAWTVEQVLEEVNKDISFYRKSRGGVTLSGGEPLFQPAFCLSLLKSFKENHLNTALETCGLASWKDLEQGLRLIDYLFFDLKCSDEKKHIELTGASNVRILENAIHAASMMKKQEKTMVIRIPLIPGYNDDLENISQLCQFISKNLSGVKLVELLPYHRLGEKKYQRLGRQYLLAGLASPGREKLEQCYSIVESYGLKVHCE